MFTFDSGAPEVVRALRARLGPDVVLFGTAGLTPLPSLIERAGSAARGVLMPFAGTLRADQYSREGRGFVRAFQRSIGGAPVEPSAVLAAQSMEVALAALARSDGSRASMEELFRTRIEKGLIGSVTFDANGDIQESPVTVLRVEPGTRDVPGSEDVVIDSVEWVPSALAP